MDDNSVQRPPAPDGLQAAGKALWTDVLAEFEMNAAELRLLNQAAQTLDELAAMKSDLAEMGTVVMGSRNQPRINPLLSAIAAHRKLFDQLVVALGLPLENEVVGRRRSAAARQSVDARWRQQRRGRLPAVAPVRQNGGA